MKKRRYSPDGYLNSLYAHVYRSPYDGVTGRESCLAVSAGIRRKLKDLIAIDAIPGKIYELKPIIIATADRGEYVQETLSVEICWGWNMLCYLLTPKKPSSSGVVAVCGHGYGCRQIIRQSKNGGYRVINFLDNYQKNFAAELAIHGNTVIVPEPIGFGEAKNDSDAYKPFYSNSCSKISELTLLYGLTTASLRIYQVMRCIDLLKARGFNKAGCMGISGGGLVTLYSACLDERITRAAVSGYINTFKDSVMAMWHCPDNYIPGILRIGEIYDFASAIAPRKLLIESGTKDRLFPREGVKTALANISRIYRETEAEENLIVDVFEGGHRISGLKSFTFFS